MRFSLALLPLIAGLAFAAPVLAQSGQPAPPFSVRDLEGRTVRLQDLRGRPVVLDFWATWCAPCRVSMPDLDALQERYADQGLVVLGLSLDEEGTPVVKRFIARLGIRFRIALANEKMLAQYGPIRSAPTTVFINRKGVVVRRVVGYVDRETMESFIRELF
ncbi:MAG: TlpA disulfide reductase family protein [Candidatus Eisenbacteria bacterium]